jgi:hypothetical protein
MKHYSPLCLPHLTPLNQILATGHYWFDCLRMGTLLSHLDLADFPVMIINQLTRGFKTELPVFLHYFEFHLVSTS